jgi:predicted HicB family RNase H-like nuclease
MSIGKDKVRSNLIIEKAMKKDLEELAEKQNRSLNNLVITILKEYLAEHKKDAEA